MRLSDHAKELDTQRFQVWTWIMVLWFYIQDLVSLYFAELHDLGTHLGAHLGSPESTGTNRPVEPSVDRQVPCVHVFCFMSFCFGYLKWTQSRVCQNLLIVWVDMCKMATGSISEKTSWGPFVWEWIPLVNLRTRTSLCGIESLWFL